MCLSQNSPCSAFRLLNLVASPSATPAASVSTFLMAQGASKKAPLPECSTVNRWQFWKAETQREKENAEDREGLGSGPGSSFGAPAGWSAAGTAGPATSEPHGQGVASGPREATHPGRLWLPGWEAFCITQGKTSKCKHQIYFLGSFLGGFTNQSALCSLWHFKPDPAFGTAF